MIRRKSVAEFSSAFDFACWCGNREAVPFCAQMFRRKFVVLRCCACGTHRILPRALQSQNDATRLYNLQEHTRAVIPNAVLEENAQKILERIQRVGIAFNGNQTVIDIGCSDGLLIESIRRRSGCRAIGVDVDQKVLALAQQNYPQVEFIQARLDEVEKTLPAADVVIASAILEHVTDPKNFLKTLKDLLNPGGHIFLLTPNSDSRNYLILRSCWRELLAIGEHIYLFNPTSIGTLAELVGLQIKEMATGYDRTILSFQIRSGKDLVIVCWRIILYVVKWACQRRANDFKGDILFLHLEAEQMLRQPSHKL